jgi:hypothetical protein
MRLAERIHQSSPAAGALHDGFKAAHHYAQHLTLVSQSFHRFRMPVRIDRFLII